MTEKREEAKSFDEPKPSTAKPVTLYKGTDTQTVPSELAEYMTTRGWSKTKPTKKK